MRSIALSIVVTFAVRAYAEEPDKVMDGMQASTDKSDDKLADDLVDTLFERARESLSLHNEDLDDAALGKGGQVASPSQTLGRLATPAIHSQNLGRLGQLASPYQNSALLPQQPQPLLQGSLLQQLQPHPVLNRSPMRLPPPNAARMVFVRYGRHKKPFYRIAVKNNQGKKIVEFLGSYNPLSKELKIDPERAKYWLTVGAQPSKTVGNILQKILIR